MIVRSLDVNGDWTFGKGRNNYLSKNRAIVQNISTRLNSFLGDCFFALDQGIDWFNLLGQKDKRALELAVRTVIINTAGVQQLVDVSVNLEETTRRITMTYSVNTVYSTVNSQLDLVTASTSFLLAEDGSIITTENSDALGLG